VLRPGAVGREGFAGGPQDAAAQQLPTLSWVRAAWDLGLGESEVLTFALTHPGYRAMVGDEGHGVVHGLSVFPSFFASALQPWS